MIQTQNSKQYDLEERTFQFAEKVREFIKKLPTSIGNREDSSQLIRASGSVGANYIEATESLSKKDFYHRIKISRKEAKESRFWLKLIRIERNMILEEHRSALAQEALELTKIFGAIISKSPFNL